MPKSKYIDLNPREADELIARISDNKLSTNDLQLLKTIVINYFWVLNQLKKGALKIKTLAGFLLGFKSEKLKSVINSKEEDPDDSEQNGSASSNQDTSAATNKPGHGRNAANQYHSKKVTIDIENLKEGAQCPQQNCDGKLYAITPSTIVRLTATGLFEATSYVLTSLRCALCGAIFRASLPKSAGDDKYSKEAISWLSFYKYYAGLPFKRIETIQNLSGIPMPDATQWLLMNRFGAQIEPIYNYLMLLSGEATILHADDTRCQILAQETGNTKRKAQYTTGMVSTFENHTIHLFMSGRCYAGENVSNLLKNRTDNSKLIYMTDAHSMNNLKDKDIDANIISKLIVVYCLVHARRQFLRLLDIFSEEVRHVLELIAKVYANEKHCNDLKFDDEQRLSYHREYSEPILDEWKIWLHTQLGEKRTEPNSSLGKAINYVLKRWSQLTAFTRVAGCPIDNNVVERALRIPIRLRKSAYFYKTSRGALVGDSSMSLIYTCIAAKQNPIEYCTMLQENASAVIENPGYWLPWNFKDQLQNQLVA